MKLQASIIDLHIDAVDEYDVNVREQSERLREPLDESHRARVQALATAGTRLHLGAHTVHEALHERRQHLRTHRQERHQLRRGRQHPLPYRRARDHVRHQVRDPVVHPPDGAARANDSALACERKRVLRVARLAAETNESEFRTAARPKPVELSPHEVGKAKVIAVRPSEALFERRPVPLKQLKDDALVRRAGAVDRLSSRAPSKLSASRGPARRAELDPVKERQRTRRQSAHAKA
jgi:hypothetical protein